MFTDFNHVMLWVKDLELAKKFYGEGLGMPFISEEYRMPVKFNKAYFGSEKMVLELFEWEDPESTRMTPTETSAPASPTSACGWTASKRPAKNWRPPAFPTL